MKLFAAIALASVMAVPAIASGEEPAPTAKTLKPVTIVGRLNRPSVVIEVTRPTAAHEAGAAHEASRVSIAR